MTNDRTFVIVGASLAGAKAAETLRAEGFDERVVLIGAEHERPYERPPLSKDLLRGESEREAAHVHPAGFYDERDIDLRTGAAATAIDVAGHAVTLEGGERLPYDRLLLATGAEPRRIGIPGADLDGVLVLRTLPDSERLAASIRGDGRLVVIGAGWIGSEAAASARVMGSEVTVVERLDVPLETVLGAELGGMYGDLHREHGVELLTGAGVEAFEGDGRVERVRLAGGRTLDCGAVLVGIGVVPRTGLAEEAGLDVENGVLVDATLRTSAPDIWAAGDIAAHMHPRYGRRVRVEHWANALNQGPAAARNMLGADEPFDRLPYFFSDQYDVGMEYSGLAAHDDQVVVRGDLSSREVIAFWTAGGRVTAAMNVNVWDVTDDLQELIRSGREVDPERLRDPDVPVAEL
jgi:3-phenylpropionate/trans-cinnamate dioxygenase ferredoxin reductase component